ncbi:hypothetical protein NKG99_32180 [Mesorhizobium sp. M1409]|uniref:hypothetical protein n=1 Tax=unclassified Mesorhizobium TaxID=325217 RepID=UPI00333A9B74
MVQILAGILPEVCVKIGTAAQQGGAAEARRIDATLAPLWSHLFKEFSSLRVVYALAELLDICRADRVQSCLCPQQRSARSPPRWNACHRMPAGE